MKRRILSLLLAGVLALGALPLGAFAAALPFQDVKEKDWFAPAVEYVYRRGVMNGTSSTTFQPNATMDRAQAVQLFYNLEGQPVVYGDGGFTDVSGHWAVKAIAWAASKGVVMGTSATTFSPSGRLTREAFAQMLYNYARYKGYDLSANGNLWAFPDGGNVSSWARTALGWAIGEGLLSGSDGWLLPGGTATRAQAASILWNFLENVAASPQEPEAPQEVESARFTIQKKDHSYYEENGDKLIDCYYDLLVLEGDTPQVKAINASVQKDYRDFLDRNKEMMDDVFDEYAGRDYPYTFSNTMDGEVTYNQKGILSLRQSYNWFMGGVHNAGLYGLTFNLNTGEEMALSDLFPQMTKDALSSKVKGEVKAYMDNNPRGWWDYAWDLIDSTDIDEMDFYVNQGRIVVLFEVYELAPGAAGPVIIDLSLTLG